MEAYIELHREEQMMKIDDAMTYDELVADIPNIWADLTEYLEREKENKENN